MLHADALRKTYGRQSAFALELSHYADASETWGRLPVVIICGDELQLPPVPMQHSPLASLEGTSDEHKAGVRIFSGFEHVYRLTTAMRFDDPVLVRILQKMRTAGGSRLTAEEWSALKGTNVEPGSPACIWQGTEHFYQCCYTWSVVSLAYACRSFASARAADATLYATVAEDRVLNLPADSLHGIGEAIFAHPNMSLRLAIVNMLVGSILCRLLCVRFC